MTAIVVLGAGPAGAAVLAFLSEQAASARTQPEISKSREMPEVCAPIRADGLRKGSLRGSCRAVMTGAAEFMDGRKSRCKRSL